jgi:hypothetical protein
MEAVVIRKELFSRLPADKKEYYFLRRQRLEKSNTLDPIIMISADKERIFFELYHQELHGVPCYVEDREGKRLS